MSTKSYHFNVSTTTTGNASLSHKLTHSPHENLNLFFVGINHKPPWPLAFTGRDRCWVRQGLTVHVVIVHHLDWADRTSLKHSVVRGGRQNMWATRQELLLLKHRLLLLGHGNWRRIWQVASDTRERDTGPWSENLACSCCQLSRGRQHGLTQRRRGDFCLWHCELVIWSCRRCHDPTIQMNDNFNTGTEKHKFPHLGLIFFSHTDFIGTPS